MTLYRRRRRRWLDAMAMIYAATALLGFVLACLLGLFLLALEVWGMRPS